METVTDEAALAAAQQVLQYWGLEARDLQVFSRSENVVLKAETTVGETVAVRLHRPGYHSLDELQSEQTWVRSLGAAGVGVPHARKAPGGEYYLPVRVADTGEIRQAGVVDWVPGVQAASSLREASVAEAIDRVRELGALTGRVNRLSSSWEPPAGFLRHHLDADGLMGDTPFWGPFWDVPELSRIEKARIRGLRDALHGQLTNHGKDQGDYSMIHADLHAHNVLVDGSSVAIIDFDDAGFGWHGYEMAIALLGFPDRDCRQAMEDAYIEAYRRENPIGESCLATVQVFKLVRLLVSIGWVHHRPEHGRKRIRPTIDAAFEMATRLGL